MGRIVSDTACELCKAEGKDSTNNHKIIFEDGGMYCKVHGYLGKTGGHVEAAAEKITTFTDGRLTLQEIKELPTTELKSRGIDKETALHFGIHTEFNTTTGEHAAYYYPVTKDKVVTGYKKRTLPKQFSCIGDCKNTEFLGQSVARGTKRLLIVEGQDDMLAAYQMLSKYKPDVVSLPHGANLNVFSDNQDFIQDYEEVVYCADQDEPGQKLIGKLSALYPDMMFMDISEKDPNDMLLKDKGQQFVKAFYNAKAYTPEGFVTVDDVFEEATRMPEWGKPWPWPSLTNLTYGRRLGEGYYFGAGVKIGKSECVNQLAQHVIVNEGRKIALFKLEEKPAMTVRRIAGKVKHKQFHIPDGDFTQSELIDGVNAIRDNVVLYDRYGSAKWDELKTAIRHAVVVEGVEDIVIDPLTRLTSGMSSSEANSELDRISDEISSMSKDLGFTYYIFCHLKAPQTGKPHEEGGKVHSNQFTGSRAMMRACYYMIGIERDKTQDDEVLRNTSTFVMLEDRAFGKYGSFDVYYDNMTGDYLEPIEEFE